MAIFAYFRAISQSFKYLLLKKIIVVIVSLAVFYKLLTLIAPPIVDRHLNGVVNQPPYEVSEEAQEIYDNLPFIADLHCDALLWKRPMAKDLDRAHVDLPKMHQAHVDLQVFTVVSKSPKNLNFDENDDRTDDLTLLNFVQGRPLRAWFNLKHRVGVQSKKLHQLEHKSDLNFKVVKNKSDLKSIIESNQDSFHVAGGLFGLEGAHPLKGQLKNIEYMYKKGVRMVGLVHFFDNELGGSAHGIVKGGLTEFGKQCVKEFEKRNMIIDLAHASPQLVEEVTAIATKPLVVSHTGVKGTCDRGRNLSDEQIMAVAATGGLIGIGFFEETMCGLEPKLIAEGIKYVIDLVGYEFVALGSDYDGSVEVPFNITGLPIIVDELLHLGLEEPLIRRVMGENVRDFMLKNLPD